MRLNTIVSALATAVLASSVVAGEFRSIDGSGNNKANTSWGAAGSELLRLTTPRYADNTVRFDVVALTGDNKPAVEWIRDAFTMD